MSEAQRRFLIALVSGALPIIAVILASSISVAHQRLPDCQLFIDGCVSISRAVRQSESIGYFRVLMSLAVIALFYFWRDWRVPNIAAAAQTRVRWLAYIALLALIVYVWTLGTDGRLYTFMRRIGIFVFFGGTLVAQLMTLRLWLQSGIRDQALTVLKTLTWLIYLLGLAHLAIKLSIDSDAWENRFEWWIGTLLSIWYLAYARLQWRVDQRAQL